MTRAKAPAPWTEAHQREAHARYLELAAELVRAGQDEIAHYLTQIAYSRETERSFRVPLGELDGEAAFDATRIEREVRRVRALAEGRLVRETSGERYAVVRSDGMRPATFDVRMSANEYVEARAPLTVSLGHTYRLVRVRVTRIRRA